jgi:hypothetical protein
VCIVKGEDDREEKRPKEETGARVRKSTHRERRFGHDLTIGVEAIGSGGYPGNKVEAKRIKLMKSSIGGTKRYIVLIEVLL